MVSLKFSFAVACSLGEVTFDIDLGALSSRNSQLSNIRTFADYPSESHIGRAEAAGAWDIFGVHLLGQVGGIHHSVFQAV